MEKLTAGLTLEIPEGAFPLSTDSMALAHFVNIPRRCRILDLGSGCATLGLLLCAKDPHCQVTGIELQEISHQGALENICRNGLQDRLCSICADISDLPSSIQPGSFDICVSNPPYFSGGPASASHPLARREDSCPPEALMKAASRVLKYGGDFYLVHRPERMGQLIALAGANMLEAKRLRLLRHRENGPVSLILLQLRKGGKPGLILEEKALFTANGTPTDYYREIYHMEE